MNKRRIVSKANFQIIITAFIIFIAGCINQPAKKNEYYIEQNVNADSLYNKLMGNKAFKDSSVTGEAFAWNASYSADIFVKAYQAWHDTSFLNRAIKYYQFIFDNMKKSPDGYIGLIGKNFRHELWSNEEVSDALAVNPMLAFSEIVLSDPELKEIYGEYANKYVEFAKKHVIEKWDTWGLWHEIGEYGDYIFGSSYIDPENPDEWVIDTIRGLGGMSQKFNISNKLGLTYLYLYRITKDEFYRDRAEKLFYRLKSNFQYFDDHYVWHYWVPFYEGDVFFEDNKLIHWTAVHPFRAGYQAEEVNQIVDAYHTGIVFSETDMQRIINTNMEVMWDKDTANPFFINSNGVVPDTAGISAFKKGHKSGNKLSNMGQLWTSLIDFDERVRTLYEKRIENPKSIVGNVEKAYYYNVMKPEEASFKRKKLVNDQIKVKSVPLGNSPDLTVATVIPHIIKKGESSVLVAKCDKTGPLEIALYDKHGAKKLKTIYNGDIIGDTDGQKGFRMVKWDGTDPDGNENFKGDYIIRWIFNDKYRDYAITIVE